MNQLPFPSKLIDPDEIEGLTSPIETTENATWHDGIPTIEAMARDIANGLNDIGNAKAYTQQIAEFLSSMHHIPMQRATELVADVARTAGMIRQYDTENGAEYYVLPTKTNLTFLYRKTKITLEA